MGSLLFFWGEWRMEKWFVYAKKADFKAWGESLGVDPLIARLLRNRDLTEEAEARRFLYGTLQDCHSPWLLRDMDKAAEGILSAVQSGKRIRVIGDYDVDGICASYILTRGIACLGASVDTAIPHRIHDGYGLNEHLIREAAQDGVGLIVTCDNGIAAAQQICLAKELGMEVIVTDHHEVPFMMEGDEKQEVLPEALAVVDPKRREDSYPFSGICGATVAYKVIQALAERLVGAKEPSARAGGAQEQAASLRETSLDLEKAGKALRDSMEEFLEFVSFATVCDIMELKDENRILVREGLRRLRSSGNLGLRALMQVCSIDPKTLSAYHLGFVLGPCLNATGRLDTATRALQLLSSKDLVEAVTIARDLKELNDSRKNLTLQGIELAVKTIEEQGLSEDKVLVVFLPEVHESLAGIIAGRLREQYGHPAILLTRGAEGVKGSGRSVEGYHMYEALTEVGELLTKFGGHKMAAGLSLPEENIAEFRKRLNVNCKLEAEDFVPTLHIDAEMPLEYGSMELARQMEALEPFGVGNPRPLFVQRNLIFRKGSPMGKEGKYGRFTAEAPSGRRFSLTFFGSMDSFLKDLDAKYGEGSAQALLSGEGDFAMHVVYQLGINSYHGKEELQYLMKSYR